MRLLSLFITLLLVAWLIYQMGGGSKPEDAVLKRAETKAATVEPMVQDQFARQADQLSRMEEGKPASDTPDQQ